MLKSRVAATDLWEAVCSTSTGLDRCNHDNAATKVFGSCKLEPKLEVKVEIGSEMELEGGN